MSRLLKRNNIYIIVVMLLLLIYVTQAFHYYGWRSLVRQYVDAIVALCLLLFFFYYRKKEDDVYANIINYLVLFPIVVVILKPVIVGEDMLIELSLTLMWTSIFGLYYMWKKYHVTEKCIIVTLGIFAFLTIVLQFWQLANPYIPMFGVKSTIVESSNGEIIAGVRNSILRFFVGSPMIQIFVFCFYWDKLLKKFSCFNIIMTSLTLVSIYLYLTRQILIAVSIVIVISYVRVSRKGLLSKLIIIMGGVILVNYWDFLFSDFIDSYEENSYSGDIRKKCVPFAINKITENPLGCVIGHGHPILLQNSWAKLGFYMNDIGFFGECYYFGITWIIVYFYTIYTLLYKYRNKLPLYIKMYVWTVSLDSIMIFPYRDGAEAFVWLSILYISNLHIKNHCLIEKI